MTDIISKAYTLIPDGKVELQKVLNAKWPVKADAKPTDPNVKVHTSILKLYDAILVTYPNLTDPFAFQTHTNNKSMKVIRMLEYDVKIPSLSSGKIEFGNGSRNGQGVNNKGVKYESQLAEALGAYAASGNEGLQQFPTFKSTVLQILKELPRNHSIVDVISSGSSNQKRKVPITESGIQNISEHDIQIGKIISDITVITKPRGRNQKTTETYISAKFGDTVSFLNLGVKGWFPEDEIFNNDLQNTQGKALLDLLAINHSKFCKVFNVYEKNKKKRPKRSNTSVNVSDILKDDGPKGNIRNTALLNLVRSTIGYGYIMVHKSKGGTTVKKIDKAAMEKYLYVQDVDIVYPTKGSSKLVKAKVKLLGLDIDFTIRATDGTIYPTHMVANYTYTKLMNG